MDAAVFSVRQLQLLGFNELAYTEIFPGLSTLPCLSTTSFTKHNELLLLAILLFLLTRVDIDFATAVMCFTCTDVTQKNLLKRHILTSLRCLHDNGKISNLQSSVLSDAKGHDVWSLLFQLSTLAMELYASNKGAAVPSYISEAELHAQYTALMHQSQVAVGRQQQYYAYASELHHRLDSALDSIEKSKRIITESRGHTQEIDATRRAAVALRIIRFIQQDGVADKMSSRSTANVVCAAYEVAEQL